MLLMSLCQGWYEPHASILTSHASVSSLSLATVMSQLGRPSGCLQCNIQRQAAAAAGDGGGGEITDQSHTSQQQNNKHMADYQPHVLAVAHRLMPRFAKTLGPVLPVPCLTQRCQT